MSTRKNETSKLTLSLITGMTAAGKDKLTARTFQNLSTALTDDEAITLGNQLAGLQEHELSAVKRTTSAELEPSANA